MQLAKLEQIKTAVYVSSSRVEKRPVTDRPGWGRLAPWAPFGNLGILRRP